MTTHTIEINMDVKCKQCGKGGATPSGLCLACITNTLKGEKRMATIGHNVREGIQKQIGQMLQDYQTELDAAYLGAEDEKLKISLGVDISPGESAEFKIDVSMSFVTRKIKDKGTIFVDEKQGSLFESEAA